MCYTIRLYNNILIKMFQNIIMGTICTLCGELLSYDGSSHRKTCPHYRKCAICDNNVSTHGHKNYCPAFKKF